jgi:elongation of very long chain fatty acids protein 4
MPTVLYTVLYLAIVWAGPRLMKNRQPFRLTWALIPYNLSMAALNLYIASEVRARRCTARQLWFIDAALQNLSIREFQR